MLNWQAYPRLKLASQHFGKTPADLSADEQIQLEKNAGASAGDGSPDPGLCRTGGYLGAGG